MGVILWKQPTLLRVDTMESPEVNTPAAPAPEQNRPGRRLKKILVRTLLKWGLPTTSLGATIYALVESEWIGALIAFLLTLIVSLFTILWTFTKKVYKRVLEEIALSYYAYTVLYAERRQGRPPAWKGLRIVRERMKQPGGRTRA